MGRSRRGGASWGGALRDLGGGGAHCRTGGEGGRRSPCSGETSGHPGSHWGSCRNACRKLLRRTVVPTGCAQDPSQVNEARKQPVVGFHHEWEMNFIKLLFFYQVVLVLSPRIAVFLSRSSSFCLGQWGVPSGFL